MFIVASFIITLPRFKITIYFLFWILIASYPLREAYSPVSFNVFCKYNAIFLSVSSVILSMFNTKLLKSTISLLYLLNLFDIESRTSSFSLLIMSKSTILVSSDNSISTILPFEVSPEDA